ncbi:MAG: riboflavin synthase [Thermoplasmatota archaeon]
MKATRNGSPDAAPEPASKKTHALPLYAVVDTTFSTINMGRFAVETLRTLGVPEKCIARRTVPGFKDLAVECKRLIEIDGCDIAIACGMVGKDDIDQLCAHEASLGIMQTRLATNTHVLEAFVHMKEAKDAAELMRVTENRVSEHAVNAYWLMEKPEELSDRAGTGQRQGFEDVGSIEPRRRRPPGAKPAPPDA